MEIAEKLRSILRELRENGYVFDYRFNRGASDRGLDGLAEKHVELLKKYNGFYIRFGENYFKLLSTREIADRRGENIPAIEINGETLYYPENGDFEGLFWKKLEDFLSYVRESLTLRGEDIERLDPSKLRGLKRLRIVFSGEKYNLSFLSLIESLESLEIENLEDLEVFEGISSNIRLLSIKNLTYLRGFSWLEGLRNLLELRIDGISLIHLKGEVDLSHLNWKILRLRNGNMPDGLETLKLPRSMKILEMSKLSITRSPRIISNYLLELDMRENGMEYPENLSLIRSLTDLDLSANRIKSLEWLCELSNLETLILNENLLEEFSPSCVLQNLYRLELKGNPIRRIDRAKIPNVKILTF